MALISTSNIIPSSKLKEVFEACVSAVKELFKTFLEIDNFELTSDYYDGEVEINNGVDIKL